MKKYLCFVWIQRQVLRITQVSFSLTIRASSPKNYFLKVIKPGMCPRFLKLFYEKCVYVYLFVFLHPCEQTFTWSLKAACMQTIKAKQSIHAQVLYKLCLEGVFLSQLKSKCCNCPQTSKPAFLVDFLGILQLKKQCTRPHGHPGNAYLVLESGRDPYLREQKWRAAQRLCWKNFKRITR